MRKHDIGRLFWRLGPAGSPPVVNGMDVAQFKDGPIRSLYVFLNDQRQLHCRLHICDCSLQIRSNVINWDANREELCRRKEVLFLAALVEPHRFAASMLTAQIAV